MMIILLEKGCSGDTLYRLIVTQSMFLQVPTPGADPIMAWKVIGLKFKGECESRVEDTIRVALFV